MTDREIAELLKEKANDVHLKVSGFKWREIYDRFLYLAENNEYGTLKDGTVNCKDCSWPVKGFCEGKNPNACCSWGDKRADI